jgi:Skp family chaperone for outer membrane proteins
MPWGYPRCLRLTKETEMRNAHAIFLGALVLAGANVLTRVEAQDTKQEKPPRLAVVDIGKVFQGYARKGRFEKRINKRRVELKARLDEQYDALLQLRKRLQGLRKGSDPYMDMVSRVKVAKFALDVEKDRMKSELKQQVEANTLTLLAELQRATRVYGERAGYTMVFKIDRGRRPGSGTASFQEEIFRAQIGDLVYHDGTNDITAEVLKFANSKKHLESLEKH